MKKMLLLLLTGLISASALAGPSTCPGQYASGEAPEIINQKLAIATREVCASGYTVMHSGVTRTPLWSAEYLNAARLQGARELERKNTFHPEASLPSGERAELRDYARSGYDRGHMAPSADMGSERMQDESFSLTNMVPQDADNNRNLHEGIESAVRTMARKSNIYVITGPLFIGGSLKRLNGRVLVPTHIYKAVYDPARQEAGAYLEENKPGMDYKIISIAELEKLAGINFFPRMPQKVKYRAMNLPSPTPHGNRSSGKHGAEHAIGHAAVASVAMHGLRHFFH